MWSAGGAGAHQQRALSSYSKCPAVYIPATASDSLSKCKLVLIKAAPPNYIQVRC
jgi:hypothetical protein